VTSFAVAVPLAVEQRLVADAGRYGHVVALRCSGADELASRIAANPTDAALVAATPQYLSARLIDACDAAAVRLIVAADGPDEQRYARSLGIVDAVEGTAGWHALSSPTASASAAVDETSTAATPTDPSPVRRRARGKVVTVWGPAGAPGRTAIAITLAAEFAAAGLSVALADADSHAASIDPALGLLDEAPGFAAACRLAGTGALTIAEFERIAEWHRSGHSGFHVLTGLGRPSRWPELTAERIEGVIAAAREWVDVLVLDTGHSIEQDEELSSDLVAVRRNAATLASLRGADRIVAIGAADPIGLARYLRAHAELLELVSPDVVVTVINKVRASAIGLNPHSQITQTLSRFGGISDPVLIPWDPAAFDAALLGGATLLDAAPRSPARAALRRLALERIGARGAAHMPTARRGRRGLSRAG
jgi:MinD-like ATPase involved in chromosome partitioning or flagellar assembly